MTTPKYIKLSYSTEDSLKLISKPSFRKNKQCILITGAGCDLAFNFIKYLVTLNNILIVAVDIKRDKLENLKKLNINKLSPVITLDLDLSTTFDSHQLDLKYFDYIYHFASEYYNGINNTALINNFLIDKNIIEMLILRKYRNLPKLIFISCNLNVDYKDLLTDKIQESNFNFFIEKLFIELLLKSYNLNFCILRKIFINNNKIDIENISDLYNIKDKYGLYNFKTLT